METRSKEMKLYDTLVFQIYAIVILKDKTHSVAGERAVSDTLDGLNIDARLSISLVEVNKLCTLLFTAYEDSGWCYTQMIRYLNDENIIGKYLRLLDTLRDKQASCRSIFELLSKTDLKGRLFVRGLGVENVRAYLNLLFQLTLGDTQNRIPLSDVQTLLEKRSLDRTHFLDDIVTVFTDAKYKKVLPQYCELFSFMIDNGLIADKNFSYLAKCKSVMANYILHGCKEQVKKILLEKAVNMDTNLGQFFQEDAASGDMLASFEIELNKMRQLPDSEKDKAIVEEPENTVVNTRPRPKNWFPFFGARSKKGEEEIQMQTFKVFNTSFNGQSRSS